MSWIVQRLRVQWPLHWQLGQRYAPVELEDIEKPDNPPLPQSDLTARPKDINTASSRSPRLSCSTIVVTAVLAVSGLLTALLAFLVIHNRPQTPAEAAASNATLGFEKIFALSQGTQWRLDGLRKAAAFTHLTIHVPHQPPIDEEAIDAFNRLRNGTDVEDRPLGRGATTAWLAHMKLLEFIIQMSLSSALILEDDVDWDVRLLPSMRLLSRAVRNFTSVDSTTKHAAYGTNWDVLWLGHCGEWVDQGARSLQWRDPSVIAHKLYTGFGKGQMEHLPEGHRSIARTHGTVCTFAYAVTREGAPKLLEYMRRARGEAYDIGLSTACTQHDDMRCYTVNPELFHHYRPPADGGVTSEVDAEDGKAALSVTTEASAMGRTAGIAQSVRCRVLFNKQCVSDKWT